MPLTKKGEKIMGAMKKEYGAEKGKKIFYASQNKGTIKGTHKAKKIIMHNHSKCEHSLKFCKDCDIVYCETCKEEWKKNMNNWILGGGTTTFPYVGDIPNFPQVTMCACHTN